MAKSTVKVILLVDHVYLPSDPTQGGWAESTDTMRYEGRTEGRATRLEVHPGLARFLTERKQAEPVDDAPGA